MINEIYNIKESIKQLINNFKKINKIGWIKKQTSTLGEAGKNIEILLGKENNNLQFPDFDGIELKTKKENAYNNFITLFNCTPYGEEFFEIKRLQEKYGYPDVLFKECKILNTEVFNNYKKKVGDKYYFELFIDKDCEKIFLLVFNKDKQLIDKSTFWPFEVLKQHLYGKLQYLAIISVGTKCCNGKVYYKYNNLQIFKLKGFNDFMTAIESGKIKILFKIGIFKSGKRIGKTHDRGTAFQIDINNIHLLYEEIYPVDTIQNIL